METAYFVGQRRPLSDLGRWRRTLVRFVYFVVGWSGGDQVEAQAITTTKECALGMASKPGWFVVELPLDHCLPEEPCQFRLHTFPASDAKARYDTDHRPLVAKPCAEVLAEQKGVEAAIEQVDRMRSKLKTHAVAAL